MDLDEELCLCFHVTRRKVVNYLRIERPRRASQLAECGGAGTGCGWCRPFLERLFLAAAEARRAENSSGDSTPPEQADPAKQTVAPQVVPPSAAATPPADFTTRVLAAAADLPDADTYARGRGSYLAAGGGKPPPGATPPPGSP